MNGTGESNSKFSEEKNASLLFDWLEYQPKLRRTAIHGQDGHAT